ncbi:MAG TPA: hypothetical protein PKY12_08140 [Catalimonadaceae bacterium]|nr:hypothetical protein [Catalimonadaceae bacterium]
MLYEKSTQQLISRGRFLRRLWIHLALATFLVFTSVLIGMLGFRYFENLSWLDSFYNACMNLTGNGPVVELQQDGSKIFASFYGIYGGVVVLAITAIVLAPLAHRLLHVFHLSEDEN